VSFVNEAPGLGPINKNSQIRGTAICRFSTKGIYTIEFLLQYSGLCLVPTLTHVFIKEQYSCQHVNAGTQNPDHSINQKNFGSSI
jgi:hypothetical protein